MRTSIFLSGAAFAVVAFAQDSSSIDAHPQTTFLTQTNSLGVVTGQPSVITNIPSQPSQVLSQPGVATSVGVAASIPDLGPGLHSYTYGVGTNHTTVIVFSANVNGSTSFATPAATPTPSSQDPGFTGSDGKVTPTATGTDGKLITTGASKTGAGASSSTGAAATMRAVAGSVVGVGAFMAAFL